MLHPRQHISDLAEIFLKKGLDYVVISPGSRSAPLIKAFFNTFGENCISIVDERSAGYFALGLALYTQKPVALICTSGTAVLNYAPALAEAYYQQVPLLALTADRPREWIDQQNNQTLRQRGIFHHFIKETYELPLMIASADDLWFVHRIANEAFNVCMEAGKGPVHINVPLTEPLYDELPPPSETLRLIHQVNPAIALTLPDELISEWKNARRIMIIHGQDIPDSGTSRILPSLTQDDRIIIVAENIANVMDKKILSNSNGLLSNSRSNSPVYPDLILHSGGQVVSKALTGYLHKAPDLNCWRLGTDKGIIDTFKQATRHIPYPARTVYAALAEIGPVHDNLAYGNQWNNLAAITDKMLTETIARLPFSDATVFHQVLESIPDGWLLVLGNSSVIRYSQLFPARNSISYYANRGVSGIDGSLSTAAGIAFASKKTTIILTGDLGFLYDSNALWNRELPANLRIVVINNRGGGIFHILKGPSGQPGFKKLVEAHHPVNIHKLAEAFGLKYCFAYNASSLADRWPEFIRDQSTPAVFEVSTDASISASTFRKLMSISG